MYFLKKLRFANRIGPDTMELKPQAASLPRLVGFQWLIMEIVYYLYFIAE